MKKRQLFLPILLVIATLLLALVACDTTPDPEGSSTGTPESSESTTEQKEEETTEPPIVHEHTFSDDWSYDTENHWHAATCGHKNENRDKAGHVLGTWEPEFAPGCMVNGSEKRACECGYTERKPVVAVGHNFVDGVCSVCTYKKPAPGDTSWYNGVYYGGETLKINQSINVWDDASIDNAAKYTQGPDAKGSDPVQNLCYDRNVNVAATLGLTLEFTPSDWRYSGIMPGIEALVSAKTTPDLIINDIYPIDKMTLSGMLVNVKTTDEATYGKNYFNFAAKADDRDIWLNDYMLGTTVDESKVYFVAGDYFLDVLRTTRAMYVNTDILMTSASSLYADLDAFYKMVKDGGFTMDKMAELMTLAHKGDVTGFIGTLNINQVDFSVVEPDGAGSVKMAEAPAGLAETVAAFVRFNKVDAQSTAAKKGTLYEAFSAGDALFVGNNSLWLGDLERDCMKNMQTKSALVFPKAIATQDYRSFTHDSAEVGYIPVNAENKQSFSKASAFLQLVNEQSAEIFHIYTTEVLPGAGASAGQKDMIALLYGTLGSSFEQFMVNQIGVLGESTTKFYTLFSTAVSSGSTDIVDQYKANYNSYVTGLAELKKQFAALK